MSEDNRKISKVKFESKKSAEGHLGFAAEKLNI